MYDVTNTEESMKNILSGGGLANIFDKIMNADIENDNVAEEMKITDAEMKIVDKEIKMIDEEMKIVDEAPSNAENETVGEVEYTAQGGMKLTQSGGAISPMNYKMSLQFTIAIIVTIIGGIMFLIHIIPLFSYEFQNPIYIMQFVAIGCVVIANAFDINNKDLYNILKLIIILFTFMLSFVSCGSGSVMQVMLIGLLILCAFIIVGIIEPLNIDGLQNDYTVSFMRTVITRLGVFIPICILLILNLFCTTETDKCMNHTKIFIKLDKIVNDDSLPTCTNNPKPKPPPPPPPPPPPIRGGKCKNNRKK
jgi:hypothetical protein